MKFHLFPCYFSIRICLFICFIISVCTLFQVIKEIGLHLLLQPNLHKLEICELMVYMLGELAMPQINVGNATTCLAIALSYMLL